MSQISLISVTGNSFYCDGAFSIGAYIRDKIAILIDSGVSKDVAKEVDKSLTRVGVQIAAIINTHGHGDHCGGNAFFQEKYPQIKIFSTESERPFIEDPLMAPICFCEGATPFGEVKKCKPIAPQQPSKVTDLIAPYEDQKIDVCGFEFDVITLPGHSRGMIAIKTPDNVLYCGDAIFGEEAFKKHPILFYTSIEDALRSCKKLKGQTFLTAAIVSYHKGIVSNATSLIDDHERRLIETKHVVLSMLQEGPLSLEEVVGKIMQLHKIPDSLVAYALTKASIQAYVADLEREKLVEIRVTNGIARAHVIHTPHTPES
jgi:glyoxylase-like metal-dependent hydrolase (beta-lactamase superfamily II)